MRQERKPTQRLAARDRQTVRVLDEILAAAQQPRGADEAARDPRDVDPLQDVLDRRSVRVAVQAAADRLMPDEAERRSCPGGDGLNAWRWRDPVGDGWGCWRSPGGSVESYEADRRNFVAIVRELRRRILSATAPLPAQVTFDEALASGVNGSTLYRRTERRDWRDKVGARRLENGTWVFDRELLKRDLRRTGAGGLLG